MKVLLLMVLLGAGSAKGAPVPGAADPAVEVTLFSESPLHLVPTGIAVDPGGRVFLLENNTHHRKEGYEGPPTDRILILKDGDGDGKADAVTIFHEGLKLGTDLVFDSKGNLFASTRSQIFRFPGAGKLEAGEPELVIDLQTTGTYPHNGISGICFDGAGVLHFGFGENLGHPYTMVGTDGTEFSGEAEGGSIYRCQPDGTGLEKIGTGVWNPFGMGFDLEGNLFATENDPGSSPPCRLLHVVDGSDFGYEYRYGRTGLHPLVCWNGEIPGTLPMVAGTGEAPCGIIPFGDGEMLTASWADHRIDLFTLKKKGESFSADRKAWVTGDNDFRPVDLAIGPDGVLWCSDWVNSSYPVHGMGRVWRIEPAKPLLKEAGGKMVPLTEAVKVRTADPETTLEEELKMLGDADPYVRSRAINRLAGRGEETLSVDTGTMSGSVRANFAVALKKAGVKEARSRIPIFMADADPEVRYVAVKWIADEKLADYRGLLEKERDRADQSVSMFLAVMAALDRVDGKNPTDVPPVGVLLEIVKDRRRPVKLREVALRSISPKDKRLTLELLRGLIEREEAVRLEAVRSLQGHPDGARGELLATIAEDDSYSDQVRAEAVLGLASLAEDHGALLQKLAEGGDWDASRALVGLVEHDLGAKPAPDDIDAWEKLLPDKPGDPAAGRRIFFHPKVGRCATCHRYEGRGLRVGPDLSQVRKRGGRRWLLEHILNPNAELAPQFMPWVITMKDGGTKIGLPLRKGGNSEAYLGPDGKEFRVKKPDVMKHEEQAISLMPPGLLNQLTAEEINDLLAFLLGE